MKRGRLSIWRWVPVILILLLTAGPALAQPATPSGPAAGAEGTPSLSQQLTEPQGVPQSDRWMGSARLPIETSGVPGSPSATTTISGAQLPPPDPKFGGKIERTVAGSKPWWPPRVVPPKGAPNILLIMTDDCGFGAPSTFGGVIRRRPWTVSPRWGCATPTSTPPRCARPPGQL